MSARTWIAIDAVLLAAALVVLALLGWTTTDLLWVAGIWIAISAVWFAAERMWPSRR